MHLWCAWDEEATEERLLQYYGLLSPEEKAINARFHFEKHRRQHLVTRALVRSVLSLYFPTVPPAQWRFESNEYGKPSVVNPVSGDPIEFNLSHCSKMVVLAVARRNQLGVDIENTGRDRAALALVERFFSPSEVEELDSLDDEEERIDRFFSLWTLKEAYIKAIGTGLSTPLDKFSYSLKNGKIAISFPRREIDDRSENWRFWQLRPSDEHVLSIALREENPNRPYRLEVRRITPLEGYGPLTTGVVTTESGIIRRGATPDDAQRAF